MNADFFTQIQTELGQLEPDAQRQVLGFVLSLKQPPKGMSGAALKHQAGMLSATDAQSMIDAIQAGCEQVNLDEW